MGMLIQNDKVVLTDVGGNVKFTTDNRMPHLLGSVSGTVSASDILFNYSSGLGANVAEYEQNFDVATVSQLSSGETFLSPFFTISDGDIATGGMSLVGAGSSILRVFQDDSSYYAGSMILTPLITNTGAVRINVRSALRFASTLQNYSLSSGVILGTGLTISYKIYYGRFQ